MERETSVDDTDEFEKGDVDSKSNEEGNISDEHDYEYDSSDCSVSLESEDEDHIEDPTPCSKLAATDIMVLEADESIDTTWTDEKHSSYLDSMEASFVRKMYDKEYCSVDVCGHSSNSSVTVEQDCVESHPLYLNMRKPCKQTIGLLPARAFTGSWISTSSVLASPWIQHFTSKLGVLAKNTEAHDNLNGTEQSGAYTSKKREALFEAAECNPSPRSSHGTTGGGFKKLKCEEDLSHMDMKMEEQYNAKQQLQDSHQQDKAQAGKIQELTKQEAVFSEAGEPGKATRVKELPELKEKQDMAVDLGILASTPEGALSARKCDQLVPSFKDDGEDDGREACVQSVVPDTALYSEQGRAMCDMYVDKETNVFSLKEPEKVAAQSGSKTWTWDSRGRRHRVGEGTSSVNFKL